MNPGEASNPDSDQQKISEADTLYQEYLSRIESGEVVTQDEYLRRYPELENELRRHFAKLDDEKIPPETEAKDRILGDYRLIRKIGEGGMGAVYEAEQISLKRKVALKLLPPHLRLSATAVKKFQREAEAGGRQSHPGIVSIYTVGKHEGAHYIAQELVEGGRTLADRLDEVRKEERLPLGYFRDVAGLVSQIADALQHAHDVKVIHRDIKPSNILLDKYGNPKVTDFGLAKVEDALELSRTGEFAGTPYYMSPEQAMSRRMGIDHRTDIYSLGVTIYEMLTLKRPFEGKTSQEVLKKIILIDPMDPQKASARVPHDLGTICMKAMDKVPERRYQTMREFGEDLQRFLQGEVILAKPAGPVTRLWKRVKRNPVVSTAVGVAILAVLVIATIVPWVIAHETQKRKDQAVAAKAEIEKQRNEAVAARKEADLQRDTAEEQARIAEERYEQIIRLADVKRLADLERSAEKLWPSHPENILPMKSWLESAEAIADRLDEHRATLTALRQGAISFNEQDGSRDIESNSKGDDLREIANPAHDELGHQVTQRRIWKFEDTETQWQHDTLAGLVSGIERLMDDEMGALKSVKERLDFASTIKKRSIEDPRELWDEAISSIADEQECPQYGGLDLKKMIGFVPIDRDPVSGLWEFAHLQTGDVPDRDKEGRILLNEATCLVFVLIPGGSFQMGAIGSSETNPIGSPYVDPEAKFDEGPLHEVTLKPFLLSKYEMTQGQWLRFKMVNPSYYDPGKKLGDKVVNLLHPVENVSFEDCANLLFQLNLRLPSEAEWEYACRACTTTVWWTGNDMKSLKGAANLCDLFYHNNGGDPTHAYEEWLDDGYTVHAPVGSFLPNAFGLYNILGNVWEWCRDSYASSYISTPRDGSAFESRGSSYRVLRGGCWHEVAFHCRSADRGRNIPGGHTSNLGVRPAADVLIDDQ